MVDVSAGVTTSGGTGAGDAAGELEAQLGSLAGLVESTLQETAPGSPAHAGLLRISATAARARELLATLRAPRPLSGGDPAAAVSRGPTAPRGDERVLLVEDEPMVRSAHRRLLSSLGYQVTAVADGQEALQALRDAAAPFDLVMTDQTMPRLTGIELAQALRTERPGLPVLLCSGFSDSPEEAAAKEAGVAACLQKPIDRASLASVLRLVLEARQGASRRP
jgi:CheY-like chemotaxis protein